MIHRVFAKSNDLAASKSDADQVDIDKLKNVPNNLTIFKSKVDKLDIGKLEISAVYWSKLSNVVKNDIVKKKWISWISLKS